MTEADLQAIETRHAMGRTKREDVVALIARVRHLQKLYANVLATCATDPAVNEAHAKYVVTLRRAQVAEAQLRECADSLQAAEAEVQRLTAQRDAPPTIQQIFYSFAGDELLTIHLRHILTGQYFHFTEPNGETWGWQADGDPYQRDGKWCIEAHRTQRLYNTETVTE